MDSLLQLEVRHNAGALALDVRFDLTAAWTVLFGASGSGKSTLLRCIQGWLRPQHGRIAVRGIVVLETERSLFVAPHLRAVRSAGQLARLFPGRSALRNVCYGYRWLSKLMDAEGLAKEVMDVLEIGHLQNKRPDELSGGERQRLSVARATLAAITSDSLLLLDEPFTGLDHPLRDQIAMTLKDFLNRRKVPVLSVTHDVGEAFLLGAEVVRLAEGRVVAQGPVEKVLAEERRRLLAQLGSGGESPP